MRERQPDLVAYSGWEAIDAAEQAAGEPLGRPRVKFTACQEMLASSRREQPLAQLGTDSGSNSRP